MFAKIITGVAYGLGCFAAAKVGENVAKKVIAKRKESNKAVRDIIISGNTNGTFENTKLGKEFKALCDDLSYNNEVGKYSAHIVVHNSMHTGDISIVVAIRGKGEKSNEVRIIRDGEVMFEGTSHLSLATLAEMNYGLFGESLNSSTNENN